MSGPAAVPGAKKKRMGKTEVAKHDSGFEGDEQRLGEGAPGRSGQAPRAAGGSPLRL